MRAGNASPDSRWTYRMSSWGRLLFALFLSTVLLCMGVHSAYATTIVGPLGIDCIVDGSEMASEATVSAFRVADLGIVCDPSEIEVGISCGMGDMCGLDPCLCGSPDAYGACACNGLQTIQPDVTVTSSDMGVIRPVKVGDSWKLIVLGSGSADITVTGTLLHYTDTSVVSHMTVTPASFGRLLLVFGIPVLIVAAIIALICRAARRRRRERLA